MKKTLLIIGIAVVLCTLLIAATACDIEAVSIASIEKTGTEGLVDTYTITLTNGETSTFTVTNGRNGLNADGTSSDPDAPTPDSYFRFHLMVDDTYEVFSRYSDMPSRVVIPSTYNGKPVTRIADGGFLLETGNDDYETRSFIPIDEIVLPDTITSIGERAFYNQYYLRAINISSKVTEIGDNAFEGCESLCTIEHNNGYYFGIEGKPYYMLMKIKDKSISEFVVQNGTEYINEGVFYGCGSLKSVTLPSSIKDFGWQSDSLDLTSIYYQGDIAGWCGVSHKSYLFKGSSPKNFYLQGTKIQGNLVIPAGVTTIRRYTFYSCTELTSIELPASLTEIEYNAFYGCSGLTSITFKGTKEQWGAIEKESGWNYGMGNYTIYCTNGNITK